MNKKAVKWLYQELPDLVRQGVIPLESAESLRRHYGEIRSLDRKWLVIILCSIAGAVLIGLGIISLFAHNWEDLPRSVRAGLSLAALFAAQALAFWVMVHRRESQAWKEGAAVFLSLMAGAAIALISQTYNIPWEAGDFVLTWMFLVLPLVYLMQATVPAMIYTAGITSWVLNFSDDPARGIFFWPLAALVVPHLSWALRQEKYAHRSAVLVILLAAGVCLAPATALAGGWSGAWLMLYASLFVLYSWLSTRVIPGVTILWQKPLRSLSGLAGLALMFSFTFENFWSGVTRSIPLFDRSFFVDGSGLWYLLVFLLTLVAFMLFVDAVRKEDPARTLFMALPLAGMAGYALYGVTPGLVLFAANVYFLAASILRISQGIRTNDLGAVNAGMFMLALLILTRFFDSDLNFMVKGLVFIVLGAGFLAANIVILRRKGGASCARD